jgi:hypothetical protein
MKKIKINRAKWRTGEGSIYSTGIGETHLINEEYNKCCLGFITCQTVKKKIDSIIGKVMPDYLDFLVNHLNERKEDSYCFSPTRLTEDAVTINDSKTSTPHEKELQLKELFKDVYELEFFGEFNYTPESESIINELSEKEKKYLRDYVWSKL